MPHKLSMPTEVKLQEKEEDGLVRVGIVAYTGKSVDLSDYGIEHPVVYNMAGIKFNKSVPYLLNHYRPIGHVENIHLNGNNLLGTGVHSYPSLESKEVAEAIQNKMPFQSSMGLDIEETDVTFVAEGVVEVNNQTFEAPIYVVNKSTLVEQTATLFGRDGDTSITKLSKDTLMRIKNNKPNSDPKPTDPPKDDPKPKNDPPKDTPKPDSTKDGLKDPHVSVPPGVGGTSINNAAMFRLVTLARGDEALNKIIENGLEHSWDEERITDAIKLHKLENNYPKPPSPGKDRNAALENSFLARLALSFDVDPEFLEKKIDNKIVDKAFEKGPMSLKEMLTIVANSNGGNFTGHSDIEDACKFIKRLHNNQNYSTIVFPNLLERVTQFRMEEHWGIGEPWATKHLLPQSQTNFKPTGRIRPSGGTIWEQLDKDGRIKLGEFGDEKTYLTYLKTIAQMLVFKREDIINDDLGVIEEMMNMMVEGATMAPDFMFVNKLYNGITSGFFTAGENAAFGAPATFGAAALETAYNAVQNHSIQKGGLSVKTKFDTKWMLVIPQALEREAWELLEQSRLVSGDNTPQGDRNFWYGKLQVSTFANLDNTSYHANAGSDVWGLMPIRKSLAPWSITFLNNRRKPTTEVADLPADMLGMGIRGYWDLEVNEREEEATFWNFPSIAAP